MSDVNLPINIGEFSKPATVLIEKISDAIGGLYKPYQIVRVARAEAEAERIRAESQIQLSELHYRAFYRFLEEEAKKQRNIEEITRHALPHLAETSRPEQLEDDWITNFFDKCRLISDVEMQSLWSRILVGEANAPGSYSKRTVNFLSSLDKSDAQLFVKLCTFGWVIAKTQYIPLVYDVQAEVYTRHGITFVSLQHLENIGLINFNNLSGYGLLRLPKKLTLFYFGQPTSIELQNESDNEMSVGEVLLTKVGAELTPICRPIPDPEFRDYVLKRWKEMGYIKEESTEQPAPA